MCCRWWWVSRRRPRWSRARRTRRCSVRVCRSRRRVAAVLPGIGIPTGTVQFYVDGLLSGAPVSVDRRVSRRARSIANLTVGDHSIDCALYSGDADFTVSQGNVLQTVGQGASTTTVASAPNPSVFGQSVTLTATVAAAGAAAGVPSGTVEFFDGAASLGTAPAHGGSRDARHHDVDGGRPCDHGHVLG